MPQKGCRAGRAYDQCPTIFLGHRSVIGHGIPPNFTRWKLYSVKICRKKGPKMAIFQWVFREFDKYRAEREEKNGNRNNRTGRMETCQNEKVSLVGSGRAVSFL